MPRTVLDSGCTIVTIEHSVCDFANDGSADQVRGHTVQLLSGGLGKPISIVGGIVVVNHYASQADGETGETKRRFFAV